MAKRKSLGQRSRFETFKRDGFRCQYCGRTPPEAILHVDHIIAIANGGTDDRHNLITSCRDCNLGKSSVPLDRISKPIHEQLSLEVERREQLEEYNRWLMQQRRARSKQAREIGVHWCNLIDPDNAGKYTFGDSRMRSVETFLKHLPQAEILNAVDRTFGRLSPRGNNDEQAFRYFCGICWSMIRQNQEVNHG